VTVGPTAQRPTEESIFLANRKIIERQARDTLQAEVVERMHREQKVQSLNQELAKRSTALESTNKELEAFAYSVSHDLRAPLRHMAGYTELLQKKVSASLDEKSNHYLLMILESAKRMGSLIRRLRRRWPIVRVAFLGRREPLRSLEFPRRRSTRELRRLASRKVASRPHSHEDPPPRKVTRVVK
jgi:signal transduction histidine kinase